MEELSVEVGSLEVVINAECRQLLETPVTHAFAMITHIRPSLDLKLLRDPLPLAEDLSLVNSVREDADAFVKKFAPKKEGDAEADIEGEDDEGEDDE